jgi:RNA polymerase sigma-70 factor (ECF subfamily)
MDGALIERARKGDADAFDEIARQRIDSVYRTALGILGNAADARDATQEALISTWRALPRLRDASRFEGWLHRITVNAAKMVARKRRGIREIQLAADADLEADVVGGVSAARFDVAFERLSIDHRVLLLDHHLEGRSLAEIAVALDVPEGTVKSRLFAARRALDRALEETA